MREKWASKLGLILAMAGTAVGLGNFLRFPVQAAQHGGGAFMIPYIVSFLVVGIPLMWIEWTIGRRGGGHGFGTSSAMLETLWPTGAARYLGVLGIGIPLLVAAYYVYIVSWCLGYSIFSLFNLFPEHATRASMGAFLGDYLNGSREWLAITLLVVTLALNYWINYRGVQKGIETVAKIGIPMLFLFAIILVIRTFTLGAPDPAKPDWSVDQGMGFVWNPNFSALGDPRAWVAAAGQIFFTLSLGMGVIHVYASYTNPDDDIAVTGIAAATLNEIAEVVIGASLAIPLAFAYFGHDGAVDIAKGGAFDLGFHSMAVAFQQMPLGNIFGALWFGLLFIAGLTSSISMSQPAIAFAMDHWGVSRERAATLVWTFIALILVPAVVGDGYIDALDFWIGTMSLAAFALVEVLIFSYAFGVKRGLKLLRHGALMPVPEWIGFVMKYITPAFLAVILGWWLVEDMPKVLRMEGIDP
ncbi:MAG: sodium-dependent transporter, partial [Myxococcales bacterium]|nr:sodium-dependent transporter [Myxococcales bacterium]